eukprot:2971100-Amphidinium_carterae.1
MAGHERFSCASSLFRSKLLMIWHHVMRTWVSMAKLYGRRPHLRSPTHQTSNHDPKLWVGDRAGSFGCKSAK